MEIKHGKYTIQSSSCYDLVNSTLSSKELIILLNNEKLIRQFYDINFSDKEILSIGLSYVEELE